MTSRRSPTMLLALAILAAAPAAGQGPAPAISADSLRRRLFALADDSMGGRDTDSPGNVKAADWVAAFFQRYGLQPAGERGGYFQAVGMVRPTADTASGLVVNGRRLAVGSDIVPIGPPLTWIVPPATTAIYGGLLADSTTWPSAGLAAGRVVVLAMLPGAALPSFPALRRLPRFAGAVAYAIAVLDEMPAEFVDRLMRRRVTTDTSTLTINIGQLLVTTSGAGTLLGGALASARPGQTGPVLSGTVAFAARPLRYPARNVVAVLPGADPALRGTYVAISAHNDHIGILRPPVDHDSTRAFNRVVRPLGADSRSRPPTADEAARVAAIRDSLRAAHPARADSVFNGADDDGSGTVALVELARVLSQGPRPRRSILLISHAAEEVGLVGSLWYTDHPTVPLDSIVGEIDLDMIGRGGAADLPGGGPGYIEVVGSQRLSVEFGNLLDTVNAALAAPFTFNYEYDRPGHPSRYYCRADHYAYARYGIPSVSLSTGLHLDYHQLTDEPQYIDYDQLARVTTLTQRLAVAVANMDHRPAVNGPRGDPRAPCRQ